MPRLDRILRRVRSRVEPEAARLGIREISEKAAAFQRKLQAVKAAAAAKEKGFAWYPYESLTNFVTLEKLLHGENRFLLELAGGDPVLDLGCADGDLAFFLESLGCKVRAVDYPATNYNGLRGIRALKKELNSTVEISALDLDSQFRLPEAKYGLALFLGTLYHLKNPFYALDTLARHARYCLLSTRIARFTPDKQTDIGRLPVAYLLDKGEANQDWTNYWIFSEAGLKRLIDRTGWDICEYLTVGNIEDSDPASSRGDQRAFCLLKSRISAAAASVELLSGWHELEYDAWRWTERRFSIAAPAPAEKDRAVLRLEFTLPELVLDRFGALTLRAAVNGVALPEETYSEPGEYMYVRRVPAESLTAGAAVVEFELDHALPPDETDERERGVVVSSVRLE